MGTFCPGKNLRCCAVAHHLLQPGGVWAPCAGCCPGESLSGGPGAGHALGWTVECIDWVSGARRRAHCPLLHLPLTSRCRATARLTCWQTTTGPDQNDGCHHTQHTGGARWRAYGTLCAVEGNVDEPHSSRGCSTTVDKALVVCG